VGLSAPFKKGKCLYENDRVLMWNGEYLKVKEIVNKKLTDIVTYNESTGKFQKGEILDWYNNGEKELFRVQTRTGREVNITANHPLLTEKGWYRLSLLKIGEQIAVPRKFECENFRIEDEYKIKFLAYMIADGGLTKSQLAFTKQEQIIRDDFINSVNKFGDSITQKPDKNEMYITPCNGNCRKWLTSLGINNEKSIHKVIPDWVFTLNQLGITLFLQTLFTCDGTICKTPTGFYIDYSSGSKELLHQVHHLLLRFGITSRIRYKEAKCNGKFFDSWILTIRAKKDIIKFCRQIHFRPGRKQWFVDEFYMKMSELPNDRGFLDLFYDLSTIQKEFEKTEGKKWSLLKDTIDQAIKKKGGISRNKIKQMWELTKNSYFKNLYKSEILWDKIVSITPIGKHQTYDLTVKNHHNFIANDVLVHNTWMLGEFLKAGCMSGLRVASFNLEMQIKNMRKRTYMSLTGASEVSGLTMFPCFDCASNQYDTCQRPERTNHVKIPTVFDKRSKYRPCTYCKDYGIGDFLMATWNEVIDVPRLEYSIVKERLKALEKLGKANVWLECLPRLSASVGDIERKLDNLEYSYNFIPDVLLIDYADILKADDDRLRGVEKEDDVWMALARMASIRNCCVIAPTQLSKDALDAKQIKTSHTAKWIGKLGHVDVMLALNQQPAEKEMNVMRLSCLEHRHKDFSETDNCYILQKYSSGQAHLDSYWKAKKETI
jgi:intein/homing endonuclease